MKRLWLCLWLVFAGLVHAAAPELGVPELQPLARQAAAAHMTAELLGHYHYRQVALDDALSEKIFDRYLKVLDGERLFFTRSDIDPWRMARTRLDDGILGDDLTIPFAVFNLYLRRAHERFAYARSLLKEGFDFRQSESYRFAREDEPWPSSEAEMRELWRKRVKNEWLQLKLAGKADGDIAPLLDKRYENSLRRIAQTKSEDAFRIFMNAYTMAVEPHTGYMGPRAAEDFGISMRLALVGIGAVLEDKDGHATIKELVPGSPSALSGRLGVGDRIVGVAQGAKGAPVDVVGWRLDDTVALIRGAADTVVRLEILPSGAALDARHRTVALVRKKVNLEAQAAKKSVQTVSDGGATHRIGVISLPGFYEDFDAKRRGDPEYRSAARDVARLLGELKTEAVDGIVIDLRNNGGGSLTEAVDLTGLFIDTGPVVQQRDSRGRIGVAADTLAGTAWDGPLGVLINRASASASEIFAAAIQDYGRGIVIGDNSFGKGTVQTVLDLDEVSGKKGAQLGGLRLTIAQFFRIDGSTTQLRGVQPDIRLPSFIDSTRFGESSFDNALPSMRIRAADYERVDNLDDVLTALRQRHDARVAADAAYQSLVTDAAEMQALRQKKELGLNEAERRKEKNAWEARAKVRNGKADREAGGTDAAASDDVEDDADKPKKDAKDVLLVEAAQIVGDAANLFKSRAVPALQVGLRESLSRRSIRVGHLSPSVASQPK